MRMREFMKQNLKQRNKGELISSKFYQKIKRAQDAPMHHWTRVKGGSALSVVSVSLSCNSLIRFCRHALPRTGKKHIPKLMNVIKSSVVPLSDPAFVQDAKFKPNLSIFDETSYLRQQRGSF